MHIARGPTPRSSANSAEPLPDTVGAQDPSWAFSVLLSLLWSPAESVRGHVLQAPMPFTDRQPIAERTLVLDALGNNMIAVDVTDDDGGLVYSALQTSGRCVLRTALGAECSLRDALID